MLGQATIEEKYKENMKGKKKRERERKVWHDIFKIMKGKRLQPRILYPEKLSFRFDREIKSFRDKQKFSEFSTTKPALQ